MNYQYLKNNIFSHQHCIEDTTKLHSLEYMNNEHYQFQEPTQNTDINFYQNFNNLLNNLATRNGE